jgi:hypothetical protein
VKIVTIVFASAIALSAIAPSFAEENDLLVEREMHTATVRSVEHNAMGTRVHSRRGMDARAYAPAPAAPAGGAPDFGIGSQS